MRMKASTAEKRTDKVAAGRPSYENKAVLNKILDRLSGGESLSAICREAGNPSVATIHRWRRDHQEFNTMFLEARRCQVETRLDQAFDICDDEYMQPAEKKVRIDTYKWFASKVVNEFKDKVEVTHKGQDELVARLEAARLRVENFGKDEGEDDGTSDTGVSS